MACGVYYLWDGERVVYVGASMNAEKRIRAHAYKGMPFIQAFFDPCDPADLRDRECAAIREFKPCLNEANTSQACDIREGAIGAQQ